MKEFKIQTVIPLNEFRNKWVVYRIMTIIRTEYVGMCKLTQIFATPDARAVSGLDMDMDYMLEVTDMFSSKAEAMHRRSQRYREFGPPVRGRTNTSGVAIECVETGERFRTISEAATAHGVSASALSNHLRDKPGFVSVKGKRYRRAVRDAGGAV